MKILKFGGTSIGTPERVRKVLDIIAGVHRTRESVAVVVSAFGGVTDELIETGELASRADPRYKTFFQKTAAKHEQFAVSLLANAQEAILQRINEYLKELKDVLHGVFLVKELSPRTLDFIMSFGERLSALIISECLREMGLPAVFLDARRLVKSNDDFGRAAVHFEATFRNIRQYFERFPELQVITGFIASTEEDETTTLGRSGSDYTAAIFGAALDAREIEIWTDVDGVMTADPRKVPEAFSIRNMTYDEAMEMSHFGARVIHPPTIQPVLQKQIPIRIRNTFHPEFPGTLISNRPSTPRPTANDNGGESIPGELSSPVRGMSSIPNVALIRLEGSGMIGVAGTARRLFGTLAEKGINVILITQASSEHSICFAVEPRAALKAQKAIEAEFSLEIQTGWIDSPVVEKKFAIVAVVGENMRHTPGISGKIFQALGQKDINVSAIAQGSSELNISIVISQDDEAKALNAIHEIFFRRGGKTLNLFVAGSGLIGTALLQQIESQQHSLRKNRSLDLRVVAITNSRKMLFESGGISLHEWQERLAAGGEPANLTEFVKRLRSSALPNPVFVDCTASKKVADCYQNILTASVSIVTPNKRANAGSYERYLALKQAALRNRVKFLYETNVGAGLPVISTLTNLINTGDRIFKIEAVLSGTLSYIFNTFNGENSFSQVVREAWKKGYTEPDPRDDLNGTDVARKLLILSRETGLVREMRDVELETLVPVNCLKAPTVEAFFIELPKADPAFEARRKQAAEHGKVLRYIASLEQGKLAVSLMAVGPEHPFYHLSGTDNMIAFTTGRYANRPLVIKGPGAGAEVTAAGVFAEILSLFA